MYWHFFAGITLYITSNKKSNPIENEINKVVEMAIADGNLTSSERKIIKQIATEKNLDYNKIIKDAEKQISKLKVDPETELIDYKKKNGDDFEKFIIQKFDKKYFRIKEWAGDKYVNGIYAETTLQPDILLEFNYRQKTTKFSVECKWRTKLSEDGAVFVKEKQLERYKDFEKKQKHPVFIAIGIGGKAISPEQLYIIPLQVIKNNLINIKKMNKYKKNVTENFFFNAKTKGLN